MKIINFSKPIGSVLILVIFASFLMACGGKTKLDNPLRLPAWFQNPPEDPNYMFSTATMPSKETLEGIAKSVERFGAIDSKNLAPVGTGMLAIGAGLAVFGIGAKVAGSLMPSKEQLESIAESVEKFGKIPSENLKVLKKMDSKNKTK